MMNKFLTYSLTLVALIVTFASISAFAEQSPAQTNTNTGKSQKQSDTSQKSSPQTTTPAEREQGEEGDVPRMFEFDNPIGPVVLAAVAGGAIVAVIVYTKRQKLKVQ